MVTRIVHEIYDDLDGTLITGDGESIRFTIDGADFVLDLTTENAAAFRAAIAPYQDAARRVRHEPTAKGTSSRSNKRERTSELAEVREWARANGYKVPDRGRVPAEVLEAYGALASV